MVSVRLVANAGSYQIPLLCARRLTCGVAFSEAGDEMGADSIAECGRSSARPD